jgi:hypothetical protein
MTKKGDGFEEPSFTAKGVEQEDTTGNTTRASSPRPASINDQATTTTTSSASRPQDQYVPSRVPRHQQKDQQQRGAAAVHHRLETVEDVGTSGVSPGMTKTGHSLRHQGGTHPVKFPFQNRAPSTASTREPTVCASHIDDAPTERSSKDPYTISSSRASLSSSDEDDIPGAYREGGPDDDDDMNTAYFTIDTVEDPRPIVAPKPSGQAEEALKAEVVTERNLEREVQERMKSITIEATSVKLSQLDNNKDGDTRAGSTPKAPRLAFVVLAVLMVIVLVAIGAAVGSRTQRSKKNTNTAQTIAFDTPTASPTSVSDYVWELARGLVTPVSGEDALLDQSSPQNRALWWIVHDDPTKMLLTMVQNNDFSSSSSLIVERYVLMLLYFVTNGNNWSVQFFNGNTTTCEWEAIDCNEKGSAMYLSLGKCAICFTIQSFTNVSVILGQMRHIQFVVGFE